MISFRCERSKRRDATVTMRPTLLRAVRGQRLRDEGGPVIGAALRAQASTACQRPLPPWRHPDLAGSPGQCAGGTLVRRTVDAGTVGVPFGELVGQYRSVG